LDIVEKLLPGNKEKVKATMVKVGDRSGSQQTILYKAFNQTFESHKSEAQASKSSEPGKTLKVIALLLDNNSPEMLSSSTDDGRPPRPCCQVAIFGERLHRNKQ